MSTEADNPYGFSRDLDVENAAVKFLRVQPEKVKRMRLIDLKDQVRMFVTRHADTELKAVSNKHDPPVMPTVTESEQEALTTSELEEVPLVPTTGAIRMALADVDMNDPDMKGLDLLTVPINVAAWCKETDGLHKLNAQVNAVLQTASELENAIQEKKLLLAQFSDTLDADDTSHAQKIIQKEARQLTLISKWISALLDDLIVLIRKRQDVQLKFTNIRGGNKTDIAQSLQVKTLRMKSIYSAILARLDCLQIPKLDQP